MSDFRRHSYLIIGGVPKAATTSLFYYLSEHPQLLASTVKETRFFVDRGFRHGPHCRYDEGVENYASYYPAGRQDEMIRFEATPQYLYSQGCAKRIKSALPRAKMLFCLRHPVSRLVSAYRFHKQIKKIGEMSFDDYTEDQFRQIRQEVYPPCPLQMGKYSLFLAPYLEHFGEENVHVMFFENVVQNPCEKLQEVCQYIGVDEDCCHNFDYPVHNQSMDRQTAYAQIYWLYSMLRGRLYRYTYRFPAFHKQLVSGKQTLDRILLRGKNAPAKVEMSPTTRARLADFYGPVPARLQDQFARSPPWSI